MTHCRSVFSLDRNRPDIFALELKPLSAGEGGPEHLDLLLKLADTHGYGRFEGQRSRPCRGMLLPILERHASLTWP